ncbi:phosphopyruvate hydratase [Methanococcoides burtonii]|uniref:Enolase n=1 Tax=Methanococcoides burtonii (strain DSM 6242 / NBRC 107633 / OCM 468 / ACE-M) TaxID=259564 RepID=ENO_METBU|nr:phosphopyruvate hydratase [Methanococcoides burtonii]Q12VE5.1 RecName: Full=Enolase; AltName: Full=2-phospho-D-glycerate hydro-lyase; AltName: Full=2-phosphoglycerate dehydratase [Methanococcoides burtonii DSM 6242]ABE52581.1 Enolase [Methanococcoides burtonii DSM 6242]
MNSISEEAKYTIQKVHAREILDSRGNPTVEVDIYTGCGFGRASVPSGASTGSNEALELRDKDADRYNGKGVLKAVDNINKTLSKELLGMDARNQREIDELMIALDGTENKKTFGANAILGISMATAKAAADSLGIALYRYLGGTNAFALPVPTMNVINGGKHAGNDLSIQEFMIQPKGADTFSNALRMGAETYHALGKVLEDKYGASATNVGYEGGYAPPISTTADALDALVSAIEEAGYTESEISIGLDSAASEFFDGDKYFIDGNKLAPAELVDYYLDLIETYPILSIEDPFHEESFEDFAALTSEAWDTIIVGDDLFVTNVNRLAKGIEMEAANALLLKVNQIGTISESFDAANLAQRNGYSVVVSHRSAETEDTMIADISVAIGGDLIKTGAPARSERTAKYNQLLRIEEDLGDAARYVQL